MECRVEVLFSLFGLYNNVPFGNYLSWPPLLLFLLGCVLQKRLAWDQQQSWSWAFFVSWIVQFYPTHPQTPSTLTLSNAEIGLVSGRTSVHSLTDLNTHSESYSNTPSVQETIHQASYSARSHKSMASSTYSLSHPHATSPISPLVTSFQHSSSVMSDSEWLGGNDENRWLLCYLSFFFWDWPQKTKRCSSSQAYIL